MLRRMIFFGSISASMLALAVACGGGDDSNAATNEPDGSTSDGSATDVATNGDGASTNDGSTPKADAGLPAGWLYTRGNKIFQSSGGGTDTPWMGRGVNMDDLFLCGYNNTLFLSAPDQVLETIVTHLVSEWKTSFLRVSLSMNSYAPQTWVGDGGAYKSGMTNVIHAIGANPNLYVLVTLRSDVTMVEDQTAADPEATGLPTDSTSTPDSTKYPTGTDAVYQSLVDTFANDKFVMFGLSNEPGGNTFTSSRIVAAMQHAAQTIRAEEDKLGVPHHLISVQGSMYTADLSAYATTPLAIDNVVYEVHGYPPVNYTFSNLPVIIGEFGDLTDAGGFFDDVESKQIPNLAWDFDSYSECDPDLVNVNQSDSVLTPTPWGTTVKTYLNAH